MSLAWKYRVSSDAKRPNQTDPPEGEAGEAKGLASGDQPKVVKGGPFDGFEVISTYSRAQAIEDGMLFDISANFPAEVREAVFKYHLACTSTVFEKCIEIPEGVRGQDLKGRMWDILWMLKLAIRKATARQDTVFFELYVRNHNRERLTRQDLVRLKSVCGPGDEAEPVITIMCEEED